MKTPEDIEDLKEYAKFILKKWILIIIMESITSVESQNWLNEIKSTKQKHLEIRIV